MTYTLLAVSEPEATAIAALALAVSVLGLLYQHFYSVDQVFCSVLPSTMRVNDVLTVSATVVISNSGTRTIMLRAAEFMLYHKSERECYDGAGAMLPCKPTPPLPIARGDFLQLRFEHKADGPTLKAFAAQHSLRETHTSQDSFGPFDYFLKLELLTVDGARIQTFRKVHRASIPVTGEGYGIECIPSETIVLTRRKLGWAHSG